MKSNPFFIVGVGRSGTSLIRMMFHNHPRIAIPYESHFITTYYGNLGKYGNLEKETNLRNLTKEMLSEPYLKMWDHSFNLEEIISKVSDRSLRGVTDVIYGEYAKAKGKIRWGDKSDYIDRMHIINEIFPDAQFIHIIRDGRDVGNSLIKLSWGPKDVIAAAEWWNQFMLLGRRMGAILGKKRYIEVHYEKLVESTEYELKRLCSFLGEEYSPKMLEYHSSAANSFPDSRKSQHYNVDSSPIRSRTFAWKREMHPYDVALFSKYAGGMLKEVSYDVPEIKVSKFRLAGRTLNIFLKRYFSS